MVVTCRNNWQQLGDMSAADAMQQYIETLTNVDPDWQSAAAAGSKGPQQKQGGAGGPVFSTLRDPHAEQQQVRCTVYAVFKHWMLRVVPAPTLGACANNTSVLHRTGCCWRNQRRHAT